MTDKPWMCSRCSAVDGPDVGIALYPDAEGRLKFEKDGTDNRLCAKCAGRMLAAYDGLLAACRLVLTQFMGAEDHHEPYYSRLAAAIALAEAPPEQRKKPPIDA